MRIISGKFRGRKLVSIQGRHIRPTADRVREALFNIIAHKVPARSVLDLYSGTGALGLEALSRGAGSVVFIDNDERALSILRQNIERFKQPLDIRMVRWDITRDLRCLNDQSKAFDLIFLDPPYTMEVVSRSLQNLAKSGSMASEALVVAEHAPREAIETTDTGLVITDRRRYGKTALTFLTVPSSEDCIL
jgi:16S rRNA (guanine966-N2)-methyltransferase